MALHKGWDRFFPVQAVKTTGGSFELGKGQLAVVDLEGVPTVKGLPVLQSFTGLPKDRKVQLRVGKFDIPANRSQSPKDWSTETFKIENIIDFKVDVPKESIGTDDMILGYNGIDTTSAFTLQPGDNESVGINISGEVIGSLGYDESSVELKLYLENPINSPKTMQEIVEGEVERFNKMELLGKVPVTNYVKAYVVNSESVAPVGVDSAVWRIEVADEGDAVALGYVKAQYPNFKVVKEDRVEGKSIYSIITTPKAIVTAGSFVIGTTYVITTIGTTNFTLIGASANTIGVVFTATGVGAGTGTATTKPISDFIISEGVKVKGCEACAQGYSELAGGFLYVVADTDLTEASVQTNFPNAVANSAKVIGFAEGLTLVSVVATSKPTPTESATFVTDASLSVNYFVEFSGEVTSVCSGGATQTFVWAQGEVGTAVTETYTIDLKDDKCGSNRLAEIQAAFPELTISATLSGGCQTRYSTTVTTNVVFPECSVEFTELFTSEAPGDYDSKPWQKAAKTYSATALMGIRFIAQEIKLIGSETYRDDIPFYATSARIEIAGGHEVTVSESFSSGSTGTRIPVTVLNIASEPENWGGNLWEFEDITKRYQEGVSRHEGKNYAKWILGEETILKGDRPYIDYILTVRNPTMSQGFSGELIEVFHYHYLVEPGKHDGVETVLNGLAGKAGLPTVQAYGK